MHTFVSKAYYDISHSRWDNAPHHCLSQTGCSTGLSYYFPCIAQNQTLALTQDCAFATLWSIGGGAWWHKMTMFSPAAQRAPNKLVTVISSSINERTGCNTLKSTHGRWRQSKGWLIKQYVHALKDAFFHTHMPNAHILEIWPDISLRRMRHWVR